VAYVEVGAPSSIAELRFFGGMSINEIGPLVGVSRATVERDWQMARAWLFKQLSVKDVVPDI
jgi:DNA-directed RNA polymerase specialized sigma24 family protein